MIGDPSGKSAERNLLSPEILEANIAGIQGQLARLLDFESKTNPALLLNNADWTRGVGILDFLRDIGKHFSVNAMMAKDSVKSRMETGISFTEFSYSLLQAFDFSAPVRKARLPLAGRRRGPVGQHHGRHRPDPAQA